MANTDTTNKADKKPKSLEDEIILQREKLKKLEERHKEQQRKEKEKNQKAVIELIKAEKLDLIEIARWRLALPTIAKALKLEYSLSVKKSEVTKSPTLEAEAVN